MPIIIHENPAEANTEANTINPDALGCCGCDNENTRTYNSFLCK